MTCLTTSSPHFRVSFAACLVGWGGLLWDASKERQAKTALAKNLVMTGGAFYVLLTSTPEWEVRDEGLADALCVAFNAYEWADLAVYHLRAPLPDWSMILHHLLHGGMGLWIGRHCLARIVPILLLCQEASSVFLNVRFLARRGTFLHTAASLAFLLLFLILRGGMGWIPVLVMAEKGEASDSLLVAAGYALQLRWCRLVLRKAIRGGAF